MTAPGSSDAGNSDPDVSAPDVERVYETMEPLEPYTTGELASILDAPRQAVRKLLELLAGDRKVRKKEPESDRIIWIRHPPKHECPECGEAFEIGSSHPVFRNVQFCPTCGTQL